MRAEIAYLPADLLRTFMEDVFKGVGVPDKDSDICADVLITSDKRGIDSHGIGRLKSVYYDRIVKHKIQSPITNIEIISDVMATSVIDGHHGMGMVIGKKCMEIAIEKARKFGLGAVAVRNSTHYGIAAYYPMMAADNGMIGFTCTNARPSIAPTFGVKPMLGTNPLVFAMPTDEDFHFTNDYATSIMQRGKIEHYARMGKTMSPNCVIDDNGNTITDPHQALGALVAGEAALVPIGGTGEDGGGYKGYGFATVVEILSSALQQGAFLKQLLGIKNGKHVPHCLGHFFMAINIECFADLKRFKKSVGDILRELRSSQKVPGCERIYTCGEKEHYACIERRKTGIPIPVSLQQEILQMRNELNLYKYRFSFE